MSMTRKIVVVDDDEDDIFLLTTAFKEHHPFTEIVSVSKSTELLPYLYSIIDISDLPSLIVIDMNMPVLNGMELLERIKSEEHYCRIPVVIFSTTINARETDAFMSRGASFCIEKPVNPKGYARVVKIFVSCTDKVV